MKPIVRIQGLGKRYRIGARPRHKTLRESAVDSCAGALRGIKSLATGRWPTSADLDNDHIWALRDLSLDIMPGEVLGVIGRNGAGKSTLLKLLARITEPTTGRIDLYGSLGSLLEVGTGFHSELTGRENIYLSAAILGMRRAEIERKFDEILAFAEVEKFIDTPVKHYSSGMYVRLAFAVAAHLEPEIMVVDEVLAVGDVSFQKKCLGKMSDVARAGRTIIFVSHNMASIEALCTSCLYMVDGAMVAKADASKLIMQYMTAELKPESGNRCLVHHSGRSAGSIPIMRSLTLMSGSSYPISAVRMGAPLSVKVGFSSSHPIRPILGVAVKTSQGMPVFAVSNRWTLEGHRWEPASEGEICCTFEQLPLMPGTYFLNLFFGDFADQTRDLDIISDAASFEIIQADVYGTGRLPNPTDGPVLWMAKWTREA